MFIVCLVLFLTFVPEEPDVEVTEEETPSPAISFFTAARIARWMAKAYGYTARKRAAYKSSKLFLSNWDVRGFVLEPNTEIVDEDGNTSLADTEPCTGDLNTDTDKVKYENNHM